MLIAHYLAEKQLRKISLMVCVEFLIQAKLHTVNIHLHSVHKILWTYRLIFIGQYELKKKGCRWSLITAAPAASYTWGPEIAYQLQKFGVASTSLACRRSSLVWSCWKTSRTWTDQGPSSAHAASHVTQVNWRPTEYVGNHNHRGPGAPPFCRESLATHDGERTGWKALVSSHRTAEPGHGQRN